MSLNLRCCDTCRSARWRQDACCAVEAVRSKQGLWQGTACVFRTWCFYMLALNLTRGCRCCFRAQAANDSDFRIQISWRAVPYFCLQRKWIYRSMQLLLWLKVWYCRHGGASGFWTLLSTGKVLICSTAPTASALFRKLTTLLLLLLLVMQCPLPVLLSMQLRWVSNLSLLF